MRRLGALSAAALLAVLAVTASGCAATVQTQPKQLFIATGNTTGVYYQLGGGYADLITRHMPGYEATTEATGASVENIQRVARGDAHVAFTLADTAGDAVKGTSVFKDKPQPIKALARVYTNYLHVVARAGLGINSVADLKGKRISTGGKGSGTEVAAVRVLAAAGLDPDKDVQRSPLSLPETVKSMQSGAIDALFWSGGLPTGGIADLLGSGAGKVTFVPCADLLPTLVKTYGDVYAEAVIPKTAYNGLPADVRTIGTPNLIVVREDMPDALARDLIKVLFEHPFELTKVHPEAKNIKKETASQTSPVPMHPGAAAYLSTG